MRIPFQWDLVEERISGVLHSNATVAPACPISSSWRAMNVNEAVARICIVLFEAIEPEDARENLVIGWRRRFGWKRMRLRKTVPTGRPWPIFSPILNFPSGVFMLPSSEPNPKREVRQITGQQILARKQIESLIAHGDSNDWFGRLHLKGRAIDCARDAWKISRRNHGRDRRGWNRTAPCHGTAGFARGGLAAPRLPAFCRHGTGISRTKDCRRNPGPGFFGGVDLAFFSAGAGTARQFAPLPNGLAR